MGTVIWQAPVTADRTQGTARAVLLQSGCVLFELTTRRDALDIPLWEPFQGTPEGFIECAAAIMAETAEKTVELTLADCPPIEPRGQWKRKKRKPSVLTRLARFAGVL